MADTKEQVYENTFKVPERAELTLRNVRGPMTISGWQRSEVHIVAVKRMGSEWGAQEAFDETTVEMEQSGAEVRVRTHRRGGGGLFGWMGIGRTPPQVAYTVQVPVSSDVSVRTVDSHLTISHVLGNVYARTVGGKMELKGVSGQIIVSCVDAAARCEEVSGTLASKAVDGDITVINSRLTSFWSKRVSGDVYLETSIDPSGTYEAGSVDGSFRLLIPRDSRLTAEMNAVSGSASCDLPCQSSQERLGKYHWRAVINGGGATVFFKTVSGNLHIGEASVVAQPVGAPTAAARPTAADAEWPEMAILKAVERGDLTVEQAIAKLAELDK